ncbi:putative acetyltransferase [Nakamurella leprariae]|uniref:Ferrous iron transport protein A n=1 Tax=Nakamurella leprariae TaxID=2803911 RepID=A0A939BXD3_9ACTN|nr:ferrous iron transport protein A [Nakamurella leprariae]MBM9468443.1 ferrous iron transport protein A [Nakamurella leprariae]
MTAPERPAHPVSVLRGLPLGTRVVIRSAVPAGFTDTLGNLESIDAETVTVRTRRGGARVVLASVVAAKPVPGPPPRRRAGGGSPG